MRGGREWRKGLVRGGKGEVGCTVLLIVVISVNNAVVL